MSRGYTPSQNNYFHLNKCTYVGTYLIAVIKKVNNVHLVQYLSRSLYV